MHKSMLSQKGHDDKKRPTQRSLLRRMLSLCKRLVRWVLKRMTRPVSFCIQWAGTKNDSIGLLSLLFSSKSFLRECRGVLHGSWKHKVESRSAEAALYTFRRNVHGLEKGLLMRPRRKVFALDYIEDTVRYYCRVVRQADCRDADDPDCLRWGYDVLRQYFEACKEHPVINNARRLFEASPHAFNGETVEYVPARFHRAMSPSVRYEDLLRLARERRSVRWFQPKPVPRDLIDKAIEVARFSPSACNRQPFEFRVFDKPELVQQVASTPMGTKGFADNIPVIVVVLGSLEAFFSERDRHLIYIDGSLATMAFVFALETLGLSSCCINWPEIESKEMKMAQLLGLQPHERPIILIAVGYPDPEGLVASSHKKSLSDLRTYNCE